MSFFDDKIKKYLIDIRKNNLDFHKYNNDFLAYITILDEYKIFYSEEKFSTEANSMNNKVNRFLTYYLFNSDAYMQIIYRIIFFILKKRLDFDIGFLSKERCFINIIQYRLYPNCGSVGLFYDDVHFEQMFQHKTKRSKVILDNLIDILYIPENYYSNSTFIKLREDFKKKSLLIYELLLNELVEMYHDKRLKVPLCQDYYMLSPYDLASDNMLHDIEDRLLEKHYKQEAINESRSLPEEYNNIIIPLKSKCIINKNQFEVLFNELVSLDCLDEENRIDFSNFMLSSEDKDILINHIEWKETKSLCAYFIDSFNGLVLKNERITWLPFEKLFNLTKLASTRHDYVDSGKSPRRSKEIDELIQKVLKA